MGSFVSMGSSTFGLGLCYNTHTVLLRLLKEDPHETLYCLRFCLLPVFFPLPISFFVSKKGKTSIILLYTIKDIKVSYVQIAANHCHEMWP